MCPSHNAYLEYKIFVQRIQNKSLLLQMFVAQIDAIDNTGKASTHFFENSLYISIVNLRQASSFCLALLKKL